jgi:hypothetical protein
MNRRDPYAIETPKERVELAWHRIMKSTVCRMFGHRLTIRKMHGNVCTRCNSFAYRRGGNS